MVAAVRTYCCHHAKYLPSIILILLLTIPTPSRALSTPGQLPPSTSSEPLQLTKKNFDSTMKSLPASAYVLLEFYMAWCPACQHFQPDYERVAAFFYNAAAKNAELPQVVVARIDCAAEGSLCQKFPVSYFPLMVWGTPDKFTGKAEDNEKLQHYEGSRHPEDIVTWIGNSIGVTYDISPQAFVKPSPGSAGALDASTALVLAVEHSADLRDIESATVLAHQYMLDSGDLLRGLDARQAFHDFMDLLAAAHPSDRCRDGGAAISKAMAKVWPDTQTSGPSEAIRQYSICGAATAKEWNGCKGSKPGTRGYTCGLWLLLHSLAARSKPDSLGGAVWMTTIRGFVQHFFQCSECRSHFLAMAGEQDAAAVTSRRDAVLWAWRAHNRVNERLALEEGGEGSDPAHPKQQWPPQGLCPQCRDAAGGWREEQVYLFLLQHFLAELGAGGGRGLGLHRKHGGSRWQGSGESGHVTRSRIVQGLSLALLVGGIWAYVTKRQAPARYSKHGY